MKNILSLLCFVFLSVSVLAQKPEEADALTNKGIELHDKGDYAGAIALYDQALELDKDNLFAMSEKALSLFSLQSYDESISMCKSIIAKYPGNKSLKSVYVTCGNGYDALKQTDTALKTYDEGIAVFPDYYLLHFNKGITLTGLKKYDDAVICFQTALLNNPKHANSLNVLARILDSQKKTIPAILAYSRFLILEPTSNRSAENLIFLKKLMNGNAEKTGKNAVTINISADMLEQAEKNENAEDNFFNTELILAMSAALDYDKSNKKKSEVELFMSKFETVCASMSELKTDGKGYYWEYYAPYFIEMKEKNQIETFSYLVFASSDDKKVSKWLESNEKKITEFFDWSNQYVWVKK
jgi:tetratricopeptide (TPR) repeat protein